MDSQPRAGHFAFVNALRGIAALLVMVFHQQIHIFYHYPKEAIPANTATWWLVFGFFDLGKFAVAVFFLVSGFLIPATLRKRGASLRQFIIHRVFRLYPAYWVSIAFFVIAMFALGRGSEVPVANTFINLTMFQKFIGRPDVVGVFWTLQIELVFYIVCALMFAFGKLNSRWTAQLVALGGALLCAAARYATGRALPVALFLALMLMFLGDTLRVSQSGEADQKSVLRAIWVAAIGLIPVSLLGYAEEGWRYVICYEAALITFLLCWRCSAWFEKERLSKRVFDFLGDISYGVYLVHSTVLLWIGEKLMIATGGSRLATAAVTFPAVILLSYVIYRLVEAPSIRLGRKLGTAGPPQTSTSLS
jgi:peptidoglycan/LPS O-acetylase OafA/YrhL